MAWSGLMDFRRIENEMISGLTQEQIDELQKNQCNQITENETNIQVNGNYYENCLFNDIDESIFNGLLFEEDALIDSPIVNDRKNSSEPSVERFGKALSNEEVCDLNNSTYSKNTLKRNKWAVNIFNAWNGVRQITTKGYDELTEDELNELLPKFIHEVRKKNNERYPPESLVSIIAGLQNHSNRSGEKNFNFFRSSNFLPINKALNASMILSKRCGASLKRKSAETIDLSDEKKLWESSFGSEDADKLLNTLFYLNGLHFALRGGTEHCDLRIDQFEISERNGRKCLIYRECTSKTNQGGLRDVRRQDKEVVHFENTEDKTKCHIALFEKFVSVRPPNIERFYLQAATGRGAKYWYTTRPIGKNTLSKMVEKFCSTAGVKGRKTNHSLRATCATRLYESGIDEQLIMERTGHASVQGVRCYKRTSDTLIARCSAVLDSGELQNCIQSRCNQGATSMNFNFAPGCNITIINNKS